MHLFYLKGRDAQREAERERDRAQMSAAPRLGQAEARYPQSACHVQGRAKMLSRPVASLRAHS